MAEDMFNQNHQQKPSTNNQSTNFSSSNRPNPRPNYSQNTSSPSGASQNNNYDKEEALKRLGQQLNKQPKKQKKGGKIVIIILIVLLVALLGVAIWYFIQGDREIDTGNAIKISMEITEEVEGSVGDVSITSEPIHPGDAFTVVCKARNANKYTGDSSSDATSPIYLRFSVTIEVDGVIYNDLVLPNPSNSNWHIYNPAEESESYVWDGYYYYYGKLNYNATVELFNTLQFNFEKIPNSFGNKTGVITIKIDAVEANIDIIGVNGGAWETAPSKWVENMKAGHNNDTPPIDIEV